MYRLLYSSIASRFLHFFLASAKWINVRKPQNLVSQKIRLLQKINKKKDILNKIVSLLKSVNFYVLNTWLGLFLL